MTAPVLLGVVLVVTVLLTGATAASAADKPSAPSTATASRSTFGVQPASASGTDGRSFLSYVVSPGADLVDHVAILNYSVRPITVSVYAADALNDADGGFALAPAGTPSRDAGGWISLGVRRVRIPGRPSTSAQPARVVVPVNVAVPSSATPGDHAAGIVAVLTSSARKAATGVRLEQRVGVRAYFRVGGALHPKLAVEGLHVDYRGRFSPFGAGSATVRYVVHNVGNVKLGAVQAVEVSGWFGTDARAVSVPSVPLLLPGARVAVTVVVPHVRPVVRSHVRVTLTPARGQTDTDPTLADVQATAGFWTIPWALLALLVVIALVVIAAFGVGRRPKRAAGKRAGARRGTRDQKSTDAEEGVPA